MKRTSPWHDISVVLFDLDDTLHDYATAWAKAMKESLSSFPATKHLPTDLAFELMYTYDQGLWNDFADGKVSRQELYRVRYIKTMAAFHQTVSEREADDFQSYFRSLSMNHVGPMPGVRDFLVRLRSTRRIGMITNGNAVQWTKLKLLGLDDLFTQENVWISEEVNLRKPDPAIFQLALSKFQMKPQACLFVGDSWKHDIQGALRVGMNAAWIARNAEIPPHAHDDVTVVRSVLELAPLLGCE